ncbi:MAG: hypothetical protein AAGI50_07010 [Pseudomonadota bacterium]
MSETSDPLSRLATMGLALPPYEPPAEAMMAPYNKTGNRLLVGGLAPFIMEGMEIPRLGADANVDLSKLNIDDLSEDHPLKKAFLGARLATLRALSVAAHAAGDDLNKVSGCVRAHLSLRTGPNFERLGFLTLPVVRIMNSLFGQPPAMGVIGATALPMGVPMLLETEFVLHDD